MSNRSAIVRVVLQARTSSSRLPAKSLLTLAGLPLAVLCAKRLSNTGNQVVLATSEDPSDNLLADVSALAGIEVFRGDLQNVAKRFLDSTADMSDTDIVVRATADNPVPDGHLVDQLVNQFNNQTSDYLAIQWPESGLPYGISLELFRLGALRQSLINPTSYDQEHVTPQLRKSVGQAGIVRTNSLTNDAGVDSRVTIDTLEDYLFIAPLFLTLEAPVECSWKDILSLLPASTNRIDQKGD